MMGLSVQMGLDCTDGIRDYRWDQIVECTDGIRVYRWD